MKHLWKAFLILALFGMPAQAIDFKRGDANGDDEININDVLTIIGMLVDDTGIPTTNCEGSPQPVLDAADFNDNEFITIADALYGIGILFDPMGTPALEPIDCGPDPTAQPGDFAFVDPNFKVLLGAAETISGDGPEHVRYPVFFDVTETVISFELYFAVPGGGTYLNPEFVGDSTFELDYLITNVAVLRVADPSTPINIPPGQQLIGYLQFELAPGVSAGDLSWVGDFFSTFTRRATLVDANRADHHPEFEQLTDIPFIRGDVSSSTQLGLGDGIVDSEDTSFFLNWYFNELPVPIPTCGIATAEALDVTDNEFITIADYLLLEAVGEVGVPDIAGPSICGPDTTTDTGGFDTRDADYVINASDPVIISTAGESNLEFDLYITSPVDIRAFQLNLRIPEGATVGDPIFEADAGLLNVPEVTVRSLGQLATFAVYSTDGLIMSGLDGVAQYVGTLRFEVDSPLFNKTINWVPQIIMGTHQYRATIVDFRMSDHHPVYESGFVPFVRGNANNQLGSNGAAVDIGDAIFLFNYLFSQGPNPDCFDSADVNNDGKVDIGDPITVLGLFSSGSSSLPHPYPGCGLDNDLDFLGCGEMLCP